MKETVIRWLMQAALPALLFWAFAQTKWPEKLRMRFIPSWLPVAILVVGVPLLVFLLYLEYSPMVYAFLHSEENRPIIAGAGYGALVGVVAGILIGALFGLGHKKILAIGKAQADSQQLQIETLQQDLDRAKKLPSLQAQKSKLEEQRNILQQKLDPVKQSLDHALSWRDRVSGSDTILVRLLTDSEEVR